MTARVWPISRVRLSRLFGASVLIAATLLFSSQLALAQFSQQAKLVGTGGAGGAAQQGWSVAVSADGNTAILGGPADGTGIGAAWVYTRSGSTWTQQQKLIASDGAAGAAFGTSVALSADGNTAIVGGPGQNVGGTSGAGTAWVFTRSGSTWTQQQELTASDGVAGAAFGTSVALSGNTAIVGGPGQNSGAGAAYVYTRSGTTWAQQQELVGTGAVGTVHTQPATGQGWSVALSADGNTAIVGGPADNSQTGAAWVFTRSGVTWSQQGSKLVGTDLGAGPNYQGYSVALSADGNTAIVGGFGDNAGTGAAWVYTRSGTAWSQQGSKLVGSGVTGRTAEQGFSVALSSDGNTAIVGGPADNGFIGAAWVYTRSGTAWTQLQKLVGTGAVGLANEGSSVALSADGNTAIVGGPQDSGNNTTGAAWVFVTPSVPFLAFRAQLEIAFGRAPNQDAFALESSFTLSSTAPGINPVTEPVTLQIGTFSTTIPPGSFKQIGRLFTFAGAIGGASLEALITPTGTLRYAFVASAQGASLTGTTNPVTVRLSIGADTGTTSVNALIVH